MPGFLSKWCENMTNAVMMWIAKIILSVAQFRLWLITDTTDVFSLYLICFDWYFSESVKMFVESGVVDLISQMCDGDARCALNSLQNLVDSKSSVDTDDVTVVTVDDAREALQRSHVQYDRLGTMNFLYASLLHAAYLDVPI